MKILSIRCDDNACGGYRASIPAMALLDRGHQVLVAQSQDRMTVGSHWLAGWDVLILQRANDLGWFRLVNSIPIERRPKVVYEVDDLLWQMDRTHANYKTHTAVRKIYLESMRRADAVIVSTVELREMVWYYLPEVACYVLPNYLDLDVRNWSTPQERTDDSLRIGWVGGNHHIGDADLCAAAVRNVVRRTPKAKVALVSSSEMRDAWKRMLALPPGRVLEWDVVPFDDYPPMLSQVDIGLAPVHSSPFNRCKSDLRLLEYGAWGIPSVFSRIACYRGHGGVMGYACETADEWEGAIQDLVDNPHRRERIGAFAKDYVEQYRDRSQCGKDWEMVLEDIIRGTSNTSLCRADGPNCEAAGYLRILSSRGMVGPKR